MDYILKRLSEPSTWRGIMAFATGLGVAISPENKEIVITFGLGLVGLIGIFTKDKK